MTTTTYRLKIAYDGTCYHGWQVQPNGVTIQQKIQEALFIILKEEVPVIGSGRTDAGVHAHGQVAHFICAHEISPYRLNASLNGLLPNDIRIKKVEIVPTGFHAQYDALGKTYHYFIQTEKVENPFRKLYSWHSRVAIDMGRLKKALPYFVGTHDFTSFANEAHKGTAAHDPVRTLRRLELHHEDDGIVRLEFEADGFLYKMVRNMVGMLYEVATSRREAEEIPAIFAAKDRSQAGQAAPPHGLFLFKVDYPS